MNVKPILLALVIGAVGVGAAADLHDQMLTLAAEHWPVVSGPMLMAAPITAIEQQHPTDPKDPVCYPRGTHPCACRVMCSEGEDGNVEFHEDSACSHFCQKRACACHPEPDQRDCQGSH